MIQQFRIIGKFNPLPIPGAPKTLEDAHAVNMKLTSELNALKEQVYHNLKALERTQSRQGQITGGSTTVLSGGGSSGVSTFIQKAKQSYALVANATTVVPFSSPFVSSFACFWEIRDASGAFVDCDSVTVDATGITVVNPIANCFLKYIAVPEA